MPYGLSRCAWWPCKVRAGETYVVSTASAAHLEQWFTAKYHITLHVLLVCSAVPQVFWGMLAQQHLFAVITAQ